MVNVSTTFPSAHETQQKNGDMNTTTTKNERTNVNKSRGMTLRVFFLFLFLFLFDAMYREKRLRD